MERITKKEAEKFWEEHKDDDFVLFQFPTFLIYWEECERMNNLSEEEYEKIVSENMEKLKY